MINFEHPIVSIVSKISLCRSSRSQMFFKIGALKNSEIFTGRLGSLQLYEKETPIQLFSCEYSENFKNSFFHGTLPVAASDYVKLDHEIFVILFSSSCVEY